MWRSAASRISCLRWVRQAVFAHMSLFGSPCSGDCACILYESACRGSAFPIHASSGKSILMHELPINMSFAMTQSALPQCAIPSYTLLSFWRLTCQKAIQAINDLLLRWASPTRCGRTGWTLYCLTSASTCTGTPFGWSALTESPSSPSCTCGCCREY